MTCCPTCGRSVPPMRFGVAMTPLKARIVDAITRAGVNGISGEMLIRDLALPVTPHTLKAHVWQINDRLTDTEYQITGRGGYRLNRRLEGDIKRTPTRGAGRRQRWSGKMIPSDESPGNTSA